MGHTKYKMHIYVIINYWLIKSWGMEYWLLQNLPSFYKKVPDSNDMEVDCPVCKGEIVEERKVEEFEKDYGCCHEQWNETVYTGRTLKV